MNIRDDGQQHYSNSEFTTYKACPQKYEYRYELDLSPVREPMPFVVGRTMHRFYEALYTPPHAVPTAAILREEFTKARAATGDPEALADIDKQEAMVAGMMRGYAQRYWPWDDQDWEFLKIEAKGSYPIKPGVMKDFTVDSLARERKTGLIWLWERKTAASIGPGYVARLGVDEQITTYIIGVEKEWGIVVEGVLYDVIRKPGIRQKQKETREEYLARVEALYVAEPDNYFYRERVLRDPTHLRRFRFHDSKLVTEIEGRRESGFWPRNTRECDNKGTCPFLPICTQGLDNARALFIKKKDDRYSVKEDDE